jgi:hypothetical protein
MQKDGWDEIEKGMILIQSKSLIKLLWNFSKCKEKSGFLRATFFEKHSLRVDTLV